MKRAVPDRQGDVAVTIVIPARNEEVSIERCLEAVAAQDYPLDLLEVLVVDGASTDGTVTRAASAFDRLGLARGEVVANEVGTTPSNLNVGLARATGEIICRVDARSLIPPDYVSRCVDLLATLPDVAVVGGAQVAVAPQSGPVGAGIARGLNNKWGMGFSRYRRGAASGPADTVYLGAFRTDDLRSVGGWDERLPTNQDFDLNQRMAAVGTVWFDAMLGVGYIPRSSLGDIFRQYHRFGRWKVRYWRMTGTGPNVRQKVILAAPVVGVAGLAAALRRPGARVPVVAAVLAGIAAAEILGAEQPTSDSPVVHATAVATLGLVAGGWLSGVVSEALRGSRG